MGFQKGQICEISGVFFHSKDRYKRDNKTTRNLKVCLRNSEKKKEEQRTHYLNESTWIKSFFKNNWMIILTKDKVNQNEKLPKGEAMVK